MRNTTVALVVYPDDFATGLAARTMDPTLAVRSSDGLQAALMKQDGCCVFTDRRPDRITFTARRYRHFCLSVDAALIVRIALLPTEISGGIALDAEPGETIYAAFHRPDGGYELRTDLQPGGEAVALYKEDYADLCHRRHLLMDGDGTYMAVWITAALGGARYSLDQPVTHGFDRRRSRLFPLHRIVSGDRGGLLLPKQDGRLYSLRGDRLQIHE